MLALCSRRILNLVFPPRCGCCTQVLDPASDAALCPACQKHVRVIAAPHCTGCGRTVALDAMRCPQCRRETYHFDRAFACVLYDGVIKKLMHQFKFGRLESLHHFFGQLLCSFIDTHLPSADFDAVIGVPLDQAKRRARGFNQTALLARHVSQKLKRPDLSGTLRRLFAPSDQARLAKDGRKANVRNCFAVENSSSLAGKKILLVDDILTTGQTASECARILKAAGARSVWVLTCARGA